jgi:hypothetical protein
MACGLGWLLAAGCWEPNGPMQVDPAPPQVDLGARVGLVQSASFETATSTSNAPPDVDVTVADSATAQDIANAILDLPAMPPGNYTNCPIDYGISYYLAFTGVGGQTVMAAWLYPDGCQWAQVTDGGPFINNQLWSLGSPGFWSHLAADLGVPEAEIFPYQPPSP